MRAFSFLEVDMDADDSMTISDLRRELREVNKENDWAPKVVNKVVMGLLVTFINARRQT